VTFDERHLLELMPAIYRQRDVELARRSGELLTATEATDLHDLEQRVGRLTPAERQRLDALRLKRARGPLAALLAVVANEVAVLEENLAQLDDDLFIETASPWAVPYIGDLIGYRTVHGGGARTRARAEVAHTIAFRRRKGTAAMLEQLARDVTGWNARVVEFFAHLATTQYMNHRRLENRVAPSMRDGDRLELVGGAFDEIPRTLDVRRVERGGRYNIPNVGLFLWSIDAQHLGNSPATADAAADTAADAVLKTRGQRHYRFSPLGNDMALYTQPEREDDISHVAEPINVPMPLTRRRLLKDLGRYYGEQRTFAIAVNGVVPATQIDVCDLSDLPGGGWAHPVGAGRVGVDPVLGRFVLAADLTPPAAPPVSFHYGGVGGIGGGEYERSNSFARLDRGHLIRVPTEQPTIQDALALLAGASGVVEIVDSGRYLDTGAGLAALTLAAGSDETIELRAAEGRRPTLVLTHPITVRGDARSHVRINGLLISGNAVAVPKTNNHLEDLAIVHCTLVPGRSLNAKGSPAAPGEPSIIVEMAELSVTIERSIVGALRVDRRARASATDSIIDAGAQTALAYAEVAGTIRPGGALELESSTVIGLVRAETLSCSNTILLGRAVVRRRQEGCVRFSFAPLESEVPSRYRCQPTSGAGLVNVPRFVSLRYGVPQYGRLAHSTPDPVRRGAEDESEMGAFRRRYEPQRHADLLTRLDEYLRVGLEAGIFYES